jgi:thioredoxin-like negative regulator of GroEL
MRQRFLIGLAAALLLQGSVFAIYYGDLLFLRQPASVITNASAETFREHSGKALERRRLTAHHLDTMAEAAGAFGMHDLETRALQRRVEMTPDDPQVRQRLADALRRGGQFGDAEALYLSILDSIGQEAP